MRRGAHVPAEGTGTAGAGPELRVVMPVHNAGPFLDPAVTSVLNALDRLTGPAELVIVDDGSTDGSGEWLLRKIGVEPRIRVLRNPTATGAANAMNQGITSGPPAAFIAVAEHDDVTLPDRFVAQLAFLHVHPEVGAVSSEGRYLGPSGEVMGRVTVGPRSASELDAARASGEPILIPHPAATFRMAALDACGLYDSTFDGAHDLELFNRLVHGGGWSVMTLPETHVHYRVHGGATSFSRMGAQRMMTRYIGFRNEQTTAGLAVPPYAEWVRHAVTNRRDRWRWARKDHGALLYRRAGLAWISHDHVRAVLCGAGATVLHPRWVLGKVRTQVRRSPAR